MHNAFEVRALFVVAQVPRIIRGELTVDDVFLRNGDLVLVLQQNRSHDSIMVVNVDNWTFYPKLHRAVRVTEGSLFANSIWLRDEDGKYLLCSSDFEPNSKTQIEHPKNVSHKEKKIQLTMLLLSLGHSAREIERLVALCMEVKC
jgi:hypothetical protein